ncbi:type ISP restriction/modification enzyme [Corynebacterium freneyi]
MAHEFGLFLVDDEVAVLASVVAEDPFAGTSTFMVRLLQSGLIEPEDLPRKYAHDLYATEIMLLAYYVSAANIETTFNALQSEASLRRNESAPEYQPFTNIALADTFQIHEDGDIPDLNVFAANNDTIKRQKAAPINVVIGNPPYSAGQTTANDLNTNLRYPTLDERISNTYVERSSAKVKHTLYDSYLRAFRWATDRIGDQGVVAFVSNGGWLDANTGDGVRLSMAEDFTDLYVFNLRGNQRTAGEQSRREGGKVFGSGSRNTVAITIGVKDPEKQGFALRYRDIGDYLSVEEKLGIVNASTVANIDWKNIDPNEYGDWVGQRDLNFDTWPVICDKRDVNRFFKASAGGIASGRDSWNANSSRRSVIPNYRNLVAQCGIIQGQYFNTCGVANGETFHAFLRDNAEFANANNMKWSTSLESSLIRGRVGTFVEGNVRVGAYRPFYRQHVNFDALFNGPSGFRVR